MQLFLRSQSGVQFILQFRWSQLKLARVSKRYGGYRKLGSVRLARSVHASVKYRAVFMNLFFYKKTIDGANTRTNHIHFAVELNEGAVAALAGDICGEEPLVANGCQCQRVIVPVAGKDGFALHLKTAGFATRYDTSIVADDSDFRAEWR